MEVHIHVDRPTPPPPEPQPVKSREQSPVFYMEPDDWNTKPIVTSSPTRALSPCGCGKAHPCHALMEVLPEEAFKMQSQSYYSPRSSSGTYLTLPSPRAAIMSELQGSNSATRQRKVAIPVLSARAAVASVNVLGVSSYWIAPKSPQKRQNW